MKRIESLIILILLLFSCGHKKETSFLPFYNSPDLTPQWLSESEEKGGHRISRFILTNQDGKTVTNASISGKICIANFFFTACSGICPKMMHHLKKVQQAFAGDSALLFLSHSVLPEMDSIPRLNRYAQQMQLDTRNWWLLTGDRDEIYTLARRSYFADEATGYTKNNKEFLHTENCVLVDAKGRIRGIYNATLELEMEKLIRHIHILKEEEAAK
jgi:protein SCO1/2